MKPRPSWGKSCSMTQSNAHLCVVLLVFGSVSLKLFVCAVRRRSTLTSSLSATSTRASRPPPVSYIPSAGDTGERSHLPGHLIYKCGGIDKRTIEKFEKVRYIDHPLFFFMAAPPFACEFLLCWWGQFAPRLCARLILHKPYPEQFK